MKRLTREETKKILEILKDFKDGKISQEKTLELLEEFKMTDYSNGMKAFEN